MGPNTTCTDPDACNYNANEAGPCLYYTAFDVTACAGDETMLEVTDLAVILWVPLLQWFKQATFLMHLFSWRMQRVRCMWQLPLKEATLCLVKP